MMKVNWIVDRYIFENNKIPRKEFEKLGVNFFEFDYVLFTQGKLGDIPFSPAGPVVVYGTINTIRNLKSFYGCYFNENNFKTNVYMALFGKPEYYLNDNHIYASFSDLASDPYYFYNLFQTDSLFFRPLNGIKSFTGTEISKNSIDEEIHIMKSLYNIPQESMIFISTPKFLYEESRFIIGNNEIIDHSRYLVDNEYVQDKNTAKSSRKFVSHIIEDTEWVPDDLYIVDVGLTRKGPKIIELNSFSCSGWYAMDKLRVIEKVNNIVLRNFNMESKLL